MFRIRQVEPDAGVWKYRRMVSVGGSTETTLYLGAVEVVGKAGVRTFKRNIGGIAVQTLSQGNVVRSAILLHDHLGSVVSVYDNNNANLPDGNQMDYGRKRNPSMLTEHLH